MGRVSSEPDLTSDEALAAFKALANPVRLQILSWLRDPAVEFAAFDPIADRDAVGVCVSHIQARSGLAQSTVSSYMATLERAGLVRSTRVGKWTHFRRDEDRIRQVARALGGP
jgi:DNA-binding transcriptional ArsR family regulator